MWDIHERGLIRFSLKETFESLVGFHNRVGSCLWQKRKKEKNQKRPKEETYTIEKRPVYDNVVGFDNRVGAYLRPLQEEKVPKPAPDTYTRDLGKRKRVKTLAEDTYTRDPQKREKETCFWKSCWIWSRGWRQFWWQCRPWSCAPLRCPRNSPAPCRTRRSPCPIQRGCMCVSVWACVSVCVCTRESALVSQSPTHCRTHRSPGPQQQECICVSVYVCECVCVCACMRVYMLERERSSVKSPCPFVVPIDPLPCAAFAHDSWTHVWNDPLIHVCVYKCVYRCVWEREP